MPETFPCDADRSTALLLWVVKSGPAHIHQLLKTRIKLLYQTLLPLVWERFRHLPASAFGPVWQAARRAAAHFFHSRLVQYCYQTIATWLRKHRLIARPADRPHSLSDCKDHDTIEQVYQADESKSAQQEQHTVVLPSHIQADPQISARPGQITRPKQEHLVSGAADNCPEGVSESLKPGSSADPISRETAPQHLASPKDHKPYSCGGPRDDSPSECASLRGVGGLEGITRQQLRTPPRRGRMPGDWSTGAAWLQSQATAAAAAAAAALSPSDNPANDLAAHPSAAGPSPHPLPAPTPMARLASKHCRHTSTASFSAPDQAVSSSPRADALPTLGHPAAIPSSPRANALPSLGHPAAVASTSYAQAPASEAAGVAGASSSDASRSLGAVSSSTIPLLTGQESLDRATAALQALQQRYAPASSASGTEDQLSSPAATKPALQSTRSSFDFRSAVSGLPTGARLASASHTDDSGSRPQQAQAATSAGLDLTHDATTKSVTASASQDSMHTSSSQVASQAAAASAAMATGCEVQSTVGGDPPPASLPSASGQSLQAGSSQSQADSTHSDAMSQQSGTSVGEPGGSTSQLPLDLADESDAVSQQPHGSGSQSGSISSLQGEQAGSGRGTKSRVGRLRVIEEGGPMADIYNLQSPGPILLENALSPAGSLACNDSYLLALTQPGVTLKAWNPSTLEGQATGPSTGRLSAAPDMHDQESGMLMADGQVLEGQGRGQFLGPPAQRWAAASALKDSLNRLSSGSEEPEKMSDSQETSALATCEVQQAAGSVPLSHRLLCDNLAVRPKRRVRFDLKDGSESQHDQENVASQ